MDGITLPIIPVLDKAGAQTVKGELKSIQDDAKIDFSQVDEMWKALPQAVQPFARAFADSITREVSNVKGGLKDAEGAQPLSAERTANVYENLGYLTANMKAFQSVVASFSNVVSSIPQSRMTSFNRGLSELVRSATSIVGEFTASSKHGTRSDIAIEKRLQEHKPFMKGANAFFDEYHIPTTQRKNMMTALAQISAPTYAREDYWTAAVNASHNALKHTKTLPTYLDYSERMPARYRNHAVPVTTPSSAFRNKEYQGNLTDQEYRLLRHTAAENESLQQALILAGVGTRTVADEGGRKIGGSFVMPAKPISRLNMARAFGYMHKDVLLPYLEGAPAYRHGVSDMDDYNQAAIAGKDGRIAREVYAAQHALDSFGLNPIYSDKASRRYKGTAADSVRVGSGVSVRPDIYQMASLTWDDFKNGVVLDDKALKRGLYDRNVPAQSFHKFINQSILTDLLGMHGNNTFGNGSRTDNTNLPMLQLNFSDRWFKTKADGTLDYGPNGNDGKPLENPETHKIIEQLFKPNKYTSSKNGQYGYHVESYGDRGNYVPVSIKDGLVTMVEESRYLAAAQPFLDKYGVNVFDNLVAADEEFAQRATANKTFEARNRIRTPGETFSKLGGVDPSAGSMVFVDMSASGMDGGSFWMPGYLPAQAGTIRSVGIKGSAAEVDFKKMYRAIYGGYDREGNKTEYGEYDQNGNLVKWQMPSASAPDAIKELYKTKGLEAVRQVYQSNALRRQYGLTGANKFDVDFPNLLDYDVIMSDTMLKTPFYSGSQKDIQERVADVAKMIGGWRMVETDKDFFSHSNALSRQVTQNLDLSEYDIQHNRDLWEQRIFDLRTSPEKQIELLFSDMSDDLSKRVNKNKELLKSDPEARKRISDAVQAAQMHLLRQEMYGGDDLVNALALNNPAESMLTAGRLNGLQVSNQQLADILSLNGTDQADSVALAQWRARREGDQHLAGYRFPNNAAEQFALENSSDYIDRLGEFNMSPYAMWLNMSTIAKMGGGDVDGDTVQAARRDLAGVLRRTYQKRSEQLKSYSSSVSSTDAKPWDHTTLQGDDIADILYQQAAARFQMAAVSNASDALGQGDWDDPDWVKRVGRGALDLRAMYDIDSTFQKTGKLAKWTQAAAAARRMGTPFTRLFKNLAGAVENGDYSQMGDFSKVNFPSIYSGLTVGMLSSLQDSPLSNYAVSEMIRTQGVLQGIDALKATGRETDTRHAAFLEKNNSLIAQPLTGRGFIMSSEDQGELESKLASWKSAVAEELNYRNLAPERKQALEEELKEIKFQERRLETNRELGITRQNVDRGYGYSAANFFKNAYETGHASSFADAYQAEADAMQMRIAMQSGASDATIAAVQAAAERNKIAKDVAMANSGFTENGYSYSQLHEIEKDEGGAARWYDRYGDYTNEARWDQTKASSFAITLGKAVHAASQAWGDRRAANQTDYGTAEEYLSIFENELLKDSKHFPGLPDNSGLFSETEKANYEAARRYVANLPYLLRDEDIIAAEQHTPFYVGKRTDRDDENIPAYGYIDVVSRKRREGEAPGKATGEFVKSDIKTSKDDENAWDQLNAYDQDKSAAVHRVIGYRDKHTDFSRPETFMREQAASASAIDATTARLSNIVTGLIGAAESGRLIRAEFQPGGIMAPYVLGRNVRASYQGVPENIRQTVSTAKARQAEQESREAESSAPKHASKQSKTEDANVGKVLSDTDKALLTGKTIADSMTLTQDIASAVESQNQLESKLRSVTRRAQNPDFVPNQWAAYRNTLDKNYEFQLHDFKARGASEEQLADLKLANVTAQGAYQEALEVSSYTDLENMISKIDEMNDSKNHSSAFRKYQEDMKAFDLQVEQSSQAYKQLREEYLEEDGSYKSDLDAEQIDNLKRAETAYERLTGAAKEYKEQRKQEFTTANEKKTDNELKQLERSLSLTNKKPGYAERSQSIRENLDAKRTAIENDFKDGAIRETAYNDAVKRIDALQKKSSEFALFGKDALKTGMQGIAAPIKMLANQFERQIFQSAIKEVRQFVTDYNKSMTEIQMITLKSDTQIQSLGKNLINTAKELKISVSEVTNSAATLYRQGLSDEEVSDRLEVISKFSKVSGTKVDAATKLITVAMNTGLVNNATTAADIVTALGDSAATNASEIEKGIEKAGAAAAADGTTFGQLAAMLTAITSTTQIGGNVAGRTLNTIFGRMNKIGTNELIYDENGNAISGSAVAQLLQAQGINMYDANGNKRSSFDTLYALSQKWNGMSDAEQQQMANAIAGTRQYSNFAAIMQGMSEGDIDKYLELIGESSGITDQKFEIYAKSLEASVTNLRNTFDGLISDLTDSGALTGFIDDISKAIQGVDNLANGISNLTGGMGGLAALVPTVLPMLAGLSLLKTGNPQMMLAGLTLAGIGYGVATYFNNKSGQTEEEYQEQAFKARRATTSEAKQSLNAAQSALASGDAVQADNLLNQAVSLLSGAFSESEQAALGLSDSFSSVAERLDAYAAAIELKEKRENTELFNRAIAKAGEPNIQSFFAGSGQYAVTPEQRAYINDLFDYADENGHLRFDDNVRQYMLANVRDGGLLEAYSSRIAQWLSNGEFIQGYRRDTDNGELVPMPYTELETFIDDLQSTPILDQNGIETQNGANLRHLFDLMLGINSYQENNQRATNSAKQAISSTYGTTLKQALGQFGFVNDDLSSGVVDAFIGYVMQGISGEIAESAAGRSADIAGKIASESSRLLSDMSGLFMSADPQAALEQYVVDYVNSNEETFRGMRKADWPAAIRAIYDKHYGITNTRAGGTQAVEQPQSIFSKAAGSYSSWQTDSKNAYALTADAMYRALYNSGATTAQELNDYIQANGLQKQFEQLYSNSEFGRLMSQVQQNTKTGEIIYAPDDFVDQVMSFLLSNGLTYGAPNLTVAQRGQRALTAYTGLQTKSWYRSQEEKDEALRLAENSKEKAATEAEKAAIQAQINEITSRGALTPDEQTYLKEALGESLYHELLTGSTSYSTDKLFSEILANRAAGMEGFTADQQLQHIGYIQGFSDKQWTTLSDAYFMQMLSGFSGAQDYINLRKARASGNTETYALLGGDDRLSALEEELDAYIQELYQSDAATLLSGKNGFSKSLTEAALKNRAVFETGNAAEQLAMMTGFASNAAAAQNAQYYLDHQSIQSAGVLASHLGIEESNVTDLLKTEDGQKKLQEAINAQAIQMYASIAAALGADLGDFNLETADLSAAKSMLLNAAETVEDEYKDFLISLANGITDSGQILGQVKNSAQDGYEAAMSSLKAKGNEQAAATWLSTQDFSSYQGKTVTESRTITGPDGKEFQETFERAITFAEALQSAAESANQNFDLYSLFSGNETITALGGLWNRGMLSNATASSYFSDLSYGVSPGANFASSLGQDLFGSDLFSSGMFNTSKLEEIRARYKELVSGSFGPEAQSLLQTFIGIWGDLNKALSQDNAEEATERLKELGEQFSSKKAAEAEEYSNALTKIQKANEKLQKANALQDQKYAASRIRGKSGNQLKGRDLEEFMAAAGIPDKKTARKASKEAVQEVADAMQSEADKAFTQNMIKPALKTMLDGVQEAINDENNTFTLDQFIEIATEFQDTGDVDAFLASLEEHIQSKYIEPLKTWTGLLAELTLDGTIEDNGEDLKAFFEGFLEMAHAELQTPNSYTGSGKGGGGGGGGGQKDTHIKDMLTRQKHDRGMIEHKIKMEDIGRTTYDFDNKYEDYYNSLDRTILAYEEMEQLQKQQIAELEAALGTLEAYSDDWYSVSDALNEAQENLADIKNKINEINKMKLDIVLQMHENEDKPLPYQQSMYQSQADYFAATNQPGESFVFRKAAIDKNAEIIWQNNVEKGDLERLMKEQFEEGTDAWLETRDAIWKINEENAQLAAQNAQDTQQLYMDMIQQVQKDTQKWSAPNEFAVSYLDVTKSRAQRSENYLLNRNAMRAQNFMYTDRINQNAAAMARLQALLNDLFANGKYGTDEWLEAYEALNQLRTETEQYTDTIEENNKAIEQSRMDEVLQYYQDLEAALKNIVEYQSTYTSLAKSIRNYDEYQSSMKKELELNTQQTQRDDEEIARLKKLLEETTDPGVRRSLWQQITQLEQSRNSRVANDYAKDVELQKSYIDEINTPYNNRQAVSNRDLSIQETVTKLMETNGDYEGAQASREKELEMIYQQRDAKLAHIKELQELMNSGQITNAEQAEQLAKTIYQEEQEAASLYLKAAQKQKEVNDHAAEIADMLKELNFNESIGAHKLNMLQMDVAGYTKAGDLSTANDMLDKVNDQIRKNIEVRQQSIDAIKQQLEAEDLSKEKQMELYNTLMQKTEALKRDEWALRDNTAAQIENYRAMLAARAQMEAFIRKNNQKLQSDAESRVNAMANVAKSIYAVLKKEKEDEWALLSKDLEKQKQAIEEEKNLLETRLNIRKAARDKENKQRELAEYKAQLERIAADPTRTKDAKELQAKIKELQESLEDTEAEERMQSAQERMDDQIAALGDFQEYYGEQLTKFLENAQNFQKEISTIISSGMSGWISWMKEHSQEYNNMSLEMQKQAIQNWEKMWEGSHTFHDYVGDTSKIFASLESWIEYVKGSEEYKQSTATEQLLLLMTQSQNYAKAYSMEPEKIYTSLDKWLNMTIKSSELYQKASAEQQAKMEEIWTKMWDSWINIFDGNHIPTSEELDIALREGAKTTEELLAEMLKLMTGDYSTMIDELGKQTTALEKLTQPTDYTSEAKAPTEKEEMSPEIAEFITGIRTEMQNLEGAIAEANGVLSGTLNEFSKTLKDDLYEGVGKPVVDTTKADTEATQDQTAATYSNTNETRTAGGHAHTAGKKVEENTKAVQDNTQAWRDYLTDVRSSNGDKAPVVTKSKTDSGGYNNDVRREAFAEGGYVKYTGPAWVDGTPTRPESFLDAVDTKLLREQLDTYSKIKTMPMTLPSDKSFTSNSNNTIGDINIVINQADLSSDEDINEVAAKVGKIFVKEISKSGLRLDRLSF